MKDSKRLRLALGIAGSVVMLGGAEWIVRSATGETILTPAFLWPLLPIIVAVVIFHSLVPQERHRATGLVIVAGMIGLISLLSPERGQWAIGLWAIAVTLVAAIWLSRDNAQSPQDGA
jgi:peptidoglycan/LPS O-acetylase OafA/YrhL